MKFRILFKNFSSIHSTIMAIGQYVCKKKKLLTYFCTTSEITFFFLSYNHCITSIFLLYIIFLESLSFICECPKWTYGRRHISGCLQSITFEELFLTKTKYFSLLLTKRKWIKRIFGWTFPNISADLLLYMDGCCMVREKTSLLSFYVRLLVFLVIMKILALAQYCLNIFFMFVFGGNLLTYFLARGNQIAMNIEDNVVLALFLIGTRKLVRITKAGVWLKLFLW